MMSHSEYIEWLAEIGMGWLGYTERELDETNLVSLHVAYEGKLKLLELCGYIKRKSSSSTGQGSHLQPIETEEDFDKLTERFGE